MTFPACANCGDFGYPVYLRCGYFFGRMVFQSTPMLLPGFYSRRTLPVLLLVLVQCLFALRAVGANSPSEKPPAERHGHAELKKLYSRKHLWHPRNYERLRAIFAERFQQRYRTEVEKSLSGSTQDWLATNNDLAEEFFTAIDPNCDDVAAALRQFDKLCTEWPDEIAEHGELAIAVAIVWDKPKRGVYDYAQHQKRAKATMPNTLVGARENFKHLLGTNSGRFLPWEFLAFVVNHRTPSAERAWARDEYSTKTKNFGKCYRDVPYDHLMLNSKSKSANLNGHTYDLSTIRELGGVCAHQADFSSRVGKSLGIPAAYIHGENVYNDWHAWVCWTELTAPPTADRIAFRLKSSGRYRGDKYYVGLLRHPKTGRKITDRQMELELQTAGLDWRAKRQAHLIMRAYPELLATESLTAKERIWYLSRVAKLCPGNTEMWRRLAALSVDGQVDAKNHKVMRVALDQLFATFVNVPDFTWKVFDDLVQYEPLKKRLNYYDRLIAMYVQAERPDLASLARLRQTELFLESDLPLKATKALASTTLAFAADGRYAPKMLDEMIRICESLNGGPEFVDEFWFDYLAAIPEARNKSLSKYFVRMHKQAIDWYRARNNPQAMAQIQERLDAVRARLSPSVGAGPQ